MRVWGGALTHTHSQAVAGFYGAAGTGAAACGAGFYCPAGSTYGLTCPANTASDAGASAVSACVVRYTHTHTHTHSERQR